MRRRARVWQRHSRRSIVFYWDDVQSDDSVPKALAYSTRFYPQMLIEDVQDSIVPIGGRVDEGHFGVSVLPHDPALEGLIVAGLWAEHRHRDVTAATCDFVAQCAQQVMAFGEAYYEIVYLCIGQREADGFQLALVPPCTVGRRQGRLVQRLPELVAARAQAPRVVELPQEDIVHFVHPSHGPRQLRGVMRSLSALSTLPVPSFVTQAQSGKRAAVPYNTARHSETLKMAVAAATRRIGWHGRDYAPEGVLQYYVVHRQLRFERFKIELRDEILATLNSALERVGTLLDFSATLHVEGLPTLADVEAAQSALSSGRLPFSEVLAPFLRY